MDVIKFNKLTKFYGDVKGCENIDFSVKQGEIMGFIGPNGAGKSTTIRTMLSLIYPTSGNTLVFGKDSIEFGPEVRKEIGYLPSEIFYYDKMKVIDLLKYSASFYGKNCDDRIIELAKVMELDLNRKIQDLSLGNKKKVGIVQGLLHSPKLIVLDEPTSGLDPLMQQKFFNLIREENKKGATVLFSSHILGEVQQLCDRVAIIKNGEIIKIQEIKSLREDTYKKFIIKGQNLNHGKFNIEGVTNLEQKETEVKFLFRGDVNDIIKIVSSLKLKDLLVEEPSLEEIFMHYYE
ncbi:putative ABC transporter ATP-binding protein YxlF [Candidatus Izimaplasma bacterium HR1]|jgi:ABC-2 type transport system ATP-binding protein|uniref:ABC transporter ATP-binding protein n=1 Tax=Candidatus Izimoplasma sp. HR1 TaxID=1541959 RepID=UPI0004F8F76A|nr:putative ABC transporter ATP-binding protein YxlF [Candidatus Izimaplasma bacterium HR1]